MTHDSKVIAQALRLRAEEHLIYGEISKRLNIARSTIGKWILGDIPTGKRAAKSNNKIDKEELKQLLRDKPDMYLSELAKHFDVAGPSIHYRLKKLGITRKKRRSSIQNQIPY